MTDPEDRAVVTETTARVRRAPKYPAFMIVGGGIGAIVTFIVTNLFPSDPAVGLPALFGYFSLFGITGGVLIGALLAMIVDRVSMRRAREATIELTTVEAAPVEGELED
jgi:hypothetical protein